MAKKTCMPAGGEPTSCRLPTPLKIDLLIVRNETSIIGSTFVAPKRERGSKPVDGLLGEASAQVRAYFARRLRRFDLPLEFDGTAFQVSVWRAVAALSFGEFVSYAEVARAVGAPLAHRGVAMAMGRTPLDLFIPAHRVIGADGKIKGATSGSVRSRLFAFERVSS